MHMKCAVSQPSRIQVQKRSHSCPSYGLSLGRSVTQARRLYVSRLANFRVSDPRYGAEHRTCEAANRAKDGESGGNPGPPLGAYTVSLLLCRKHRARCPLVPECGADKLSKQRMRPIRTRFKFWVELGGHKPWMIGIFNNLYQTTIQ